MTARKRKPPRYTDAQKAEALEVLLADGLAAAARLVGSSPSTVKRWATAAGITPDQYAGNTARSSAQKAEAAAASVAARRLATIEKRDTLGELLIGELGPTAARLIADRLAEEARYRELLDADEERLEAAITTLEVLNAPDDPDDPASPDERKIKKELRAEAREAVRDARLILEAHRGARSKLPELVGVLTRAVHDHLALAGELDPEDTGEPFTLVLTAPRAARTPIPDVVTLDPIEEPTR